MQEGCVNTTMDDQNLTLCKDFTCPLRSSCVRYLQSATDKSIFFTESPRFKNSCNEFLSWYNDLNVIPKKLNQQKDTKEIMKEYAEKERKGLK